MITVGKLLLLLAWIIVVAFIIYFTVVSMIEDTDKQTTKPINGREYASKYGSCPMCTDCPDGCPLEK